MKLEHYNRDEIMYTNALNKDLARAITDIKKMRDKVEKIIKDFRHIMHRNCDQPAEDPCVECMVKSTCKFRASIESYSDGIPLNICSFNDYEGEYCLHKMRSELIITIKHSFKDGFFSIDQLSESILVEMVYGSSRFPGLWDIDELDKDNVLDSILIEEDKK